MIKTGNLFAENRKGSKAGMEQQMIFNIVIVMLLVVVVVILLADRKKPPIDEIISLLKHNNEEQRDSVQKQIASGAMEQFERFGVIQKSVNEQLGKFSTQLDTRLESIQRGNTENIEKVNATLESKMKALQESNEKRLEQMQAVVDEKLQKTLEDRISQSFKIVSERLEQVHKGLGEMQTLATGVGDLKKVLSNVKTRGILGEIQLGAILEQILSPEQYAENVSTKKGSGARVEFAVKLPGDNEETVYLPIDAKFPADAYTSLIDAYETGGAEQIEEAAKNLERAVKKSAKDIHDKYVEPPYTTDFAIMFLPFEGLYAEVVRRGLVEALQRDYKINIAGPTTMAALLNSLQMGFKTLAIQKHSGEVWNVLGAVKTEFDKFGDVLTATQQRINQANAELDKLIGTRTRSIQRKLRNIASLTDPESNLILELDEAAENFDEFEE